MSKSIFTTDYSGMSASVLIRAYSDIYSREFCDKERAKQVAGESTNGKCLYCGKSMSKLNEHGINVFNKDVQFDHIWPASRFNLFTAGNVAIACSSCNASKNALDPLMFNDERINMGKDVLFDHNEMVEYLEKMKAIYMKDFPEIATIGIDNPNNITANETIVKYFLIAEVNPRSALPSYETSINHEVWYEIIARADKKYNGTMTVIDIKSRLSFTNDYFMSMFGDVSIKDCSINDLERFGVSLLNEKAHSAGEVGKYRSLLNILFDILTEDAKTLFEKIPTYGTIKKSKENY